MKKMLMIILGIFLLYYFISVMIGRDNGSIREHYFHGSKVEVSKDKKESLSRNSYLSVPIDIKIIKDSLNIVKNNLNFWFEKRIDGDYYGILPVFHFKEVIEEESLLHISNLNKDLNITVNIEHANQALGVLNKIDDMHLMMNMPHDSVVLVFYVNKVETEDKAIKVRLAW